MPATARSRSQGDGASRCCAGPVAKDAACSRIDWQARRCARREQVRRYAYLCVVAAARNRQNQLRPSSPLRPVATRGAQEKTQPPGPRFRCRVWVASMSAVHEISAFEAHLSKTVPVLTGSHSRVALEQISEETDILISDL